MRSLTTLMIVLGVGLVLTIGVSPARAEIVYDNTTTTIPIPHNLGSEEGGDQVTLAGGACVITELVIGFNGALDETAALRARIYANDAAEGKPGTVLYDTGDMSVPVTVGFNTLTLNPDVEVADTFTWTLQRVDGANLQMPRYGPPTVGSSADFFWVNSQGVFWYPYTTSFEDNFYCKVLSVSDPKELLNTLVTTVIGLNLHHGIENSLDAKLDTALHALDDVNENNDVAAVNAMNAFINAVEAQRGDKIPEADADTLIAAAQQIIDLLTAE